MENQNNNQAVLAALGYPVALPQSVLPVTKKSTQIQRTQYNPEKLQAVMNALQQPSLRRSAMESAAKVLAEMPEAQSFKGAYGVDVINPWDVGLSSFARSFGSAYADRKAGEREAAMQDRENALKAAQLALDADKAAITETTTDDHIKYNDPNAKTAQAAKTAFNQVVEGTGVSKDFDPVAFLKSDEAVRAFDPIARMSDDKKMDRMGIFKAATGDKNLAIRSAVGSDIAKQMQSMVFDVVGKAGSVRIADTEDEKKVIFGPMVNWDGKNNEELATLLDQARDRFIVTAREKARLAGQDISDVSDDDLKRLFNSKFTDYKQIADSYKKTPEIKAEQVKLPQVGEVIDGYEFLGGNPADQNNWRAK